MKLQRPAFRFLLFLFFALTSNALFAQDELDIVNPYEMKVSRSKEADTFFINQKTIPAKELYKNLDTLRTYDVFLEERTTPFGIAYMCNGAEVTKSRYMEMKRFWNAADACQPCLLYTYNNKDQLKYVAYQYENCLCGEYKEYYPEGQLKVEGQFRENLTGNWENLKQRNLCSVRNGTWTYYLENGNVEKIEVYVDGKLKEVKNAANTNLPSTVLPSKSNNSLHPSNTKSSVPQEQQTQEEPTEKKNIFQKLKEKNK